MTFDIKNWFWLVGDDNTKVWSSASAGYVPITDPSYASFLGAGGNTQHINFLDELRQVFAEQYPAGMLITYAEQRRWLKEVGGVMVSGVPVATDDRSKLMITGGRVAANADNTWSTMWVGADGNTYPINAAAMIAISNAVQDHVSQCFQEFATVAAAITGGSVTTVAEVDAAFA